jgi:hypothetical protein
MFSMFLHENSGTMDGFMFKLMPMMEDQEAFVVLTDSMGEIVACERLTGKPPFFSVQQIDT